MLRQVKAVSLRWLTNVYRYSTIPCLGSLLLKRFYQSFRGPLWSEQEQRVRHFHRELDRYINREK
jgi:hypothetical protein